MRLGGSVLKEYNSPDEWYKYVKDLNYSAVIAPIDHTASNEEKKAYMEIIHRNKLVLGEVGAWSNPMSVQLETRQKAIEYCQNQLSLAEELGANCCVNIAGGTGEQWDGIYKENYSKYVYEMIVDTVRQIIDGVNPKRTYYTIEPMPWMIPDSPDVYLQLIKDIDRKGFGVHLDFTNMLNQPRRYVNSSEFIKECFMKLGPHIRSVHVKDAIMSEQLPCSIAEVMPGKGSVDMVQVLQLCEYLGSETTAYVEHFKTYDEYKEAVIYLRGLSKEAKVTIL